MFAGDELRSFQLVFWITVVMSVAGLAWVVLNIEYFDVSG
jgi:hypothetical protein